MREPLNPPTSVTESPNVGAILARLEEHQTTAIRRPYSISENVQVFEILVSTEATGGFPEQVLAPNFHELAERNPFELLYLVQSGSLPEHDLTFAAEAIGCIEGKLTPWAISALLELGNDQSSIVREGAIYGLARHNIDPSVRALLSKLAADDPSPAVRVSATEALG